MNILGAVFVFCSTMLALFVSYWFIWRPSLKSVDTNTLNTAYKDLLSLGEHHNLVVKHHNELVEKHNELLRDHNKLCSYVSEIYVKLAEAHDIRKMIAMDVVTLSNALMKIEDRLNDPWGLKKKDVAKA